MTKFDFWYKQLVNEILVNGIEEQNERTGLKTKIITGISGTFYPAQEFPLLTLRKIPIKLFVAEQIWYLQGETNLDFFQKFSKIWDDFKDDGEANTVESGYGYRWRGFFGRDQIESLIEMLQKEPSSRQGVVITWDPNTDGLASAKKKNVPCVPIFTVNIVGNKLNLHFVFRSNDVMLGLPHDIAGFAILQMILAQKLGVEVGALHYSGSHCHIYENHYEQAEEISQRSNEHLPVLLKLPENSFERAIAKDEDLVKEISQILESQYQPMGKVRRMKIAL